MLTYLVEIAAYDTGAAAVTTLRFSSQPYLHPTAPGPYDNRLKDLPTFRRDIFGKNTTGGAGAVSQGDLTIANPDGELDNLRDFGLAGQACSILLGDDQDPYSSFVPFIVGRVEQALFDFETVRIRLKDRLQDLQQNLQPDKFAGDNVLPDGLEGADNLKGKPKSKAYGQVGNATVVCVNTARLEFIVNDGPVQDVLAVRDAGALLSRGANYTDQADMDANQPSPGQYRLWPAGGYFRIRTSPTGGVSADIYQGPGAAGRTAAQVALAIVTGTGGIPAGDVNMSDVAALDADNSSVVGIWLENETNFSAALDQVLGSVGAWYGFDRIGQFRMQRMESPSSSPTTTLRKFGLGTDAEVGDLDILDCRFLSTNDQDKGVPTWRVSLSYAHNYTVLTGTTVAGSVSDTDRTYLAVADRNVISSDASVQIANPLAVQKEVTTLLANQADAQAEADRVLALYKVRRDFIEIDTPLTPEALQSLDLGQTVRVIIDRFGYDTGRNMVITGMEYNSIRNTLILALWG
jgi:hypothetical protein